MSAVILATSAILQFIAALFSVHLIQTTGRRNAWTLIAFAMTLMGVRRSISLYHTISGDIVYSADLSAELIALTISFLMVSGVFLIGPVFKKEKSINKALKQSEERYKQLVEHTNDIIYEIDMEGCFTYINPIALQIMGYTEGEALGGHFSEGIAPAYRRQVLSFYERQRREQIPNTYCEFPTLTKEGTELWLGQNVQLIIEDGQVTGFQAVARDIAERKQAEDALQESNERFRAAFADAAIGMALVSLEHMIIKVNQNFSDMLGYSKDELVGVLFKDITYPDDVNTSLDHHHELIIGKIDTYHFEKRYLHKQGHVIWASLSVSLVRDKDTAPAYAIAQIQDVTERKQVENELQKLSRAVESSSSVVIMTDLDGNIEYVNPKFTEVTGYTKEEAIGKNPRFLQSGETAKSVYADLWKTILSGGEWKGKVHNQRKNGSLYWARSSISCVRDAKGEISHFIGIQEDVTHEYELSEQLSYQASHDSLTGLVNRHEFERRCERLFSTIKQDKTEHALCFMDLDQFKVVNDTCGHTAGDELLRQLSMILQHEVRKRDTLARLGGDEFGVLMEHCTLEHANRVAITLQKSIQDYQFSWEEHTFKIGVSMGLVAITETMSDLSELMKQADAACYMAKDMGRNRIHVYHGEDESLAKRHGEMQWVTRIHNALKADQFCLYAQPIVPLDSRTDIHYELLIRMKNDEGEIIPPGAFLPAAERYNLITQLDCWVIKSAFAVLVENPDFLEQINFISINLSGQSLNEHGVLAFIIMQLNETGIDGDKFCFEITETAVISNLSMAIKFISSLKELGCRFALDDFGSGLSSFGYLKNLSVDYLKIDGIFVKDIINDPIDRAMVKSINEIGQVMGMQTIAEFVENDEIKGMLREIGVDYAQGYGLGKPLAIDELLDRSNNFTDIQEYGTS